MIRAREREREKKIKIDMSLYVCIIVSTVVGCVNIDSRYLETENAAFAFISL